MKKQNMLIRIMKEKGYDQSEIDFVMANVSQEWLSYRQSKKEIEKQLYCAYGLWRGLGGAIKNYLDDFSVIR